MSSLPGRPTASSRERRTSGNAGWEDGARSLLRTPGGRAGPAALRAWRPARVGRSPLAGRKPPSHCVAPLAYHFSHSCPRPTRILRNDLLFLLYANPAPNIPANPEIPSEDYHPFVPVMGSLSLGGHMASKVSADDFFYQQHASISLFRTFRTGICLLACTDRGFGRHNTLHNKCRPIEAPEQWADQDRLQYNI